MKELKTLIVNGNEYTVTDPNAARIDDSAVGQAAWSSKNIVDRLCPSFTESGAAVVCEPVAGYPLTVTAQEGATKIIRCGKNLLDIAKGKGSHAKVEGNTIRVTKSAGGGRASSDIPLCIPANANFTVSGKLLGASGTTTTPWEIYVVTGGGKSHGIGPAHVSADGTFKWNRTFDDSIINLALYVGPNEEAGTFVEMTDLQVELGGKTDYAPYNGGTFATGEQIPALHGINTLYADSGEITVTGRADPAAIIEKLTDAIVALGGNI